MHGILLIFALTVNGKKSVFIRNSAEIALLGNSRFKPMISTFRILEYSTSRSDRILTDYVATT